MDRGDAESGGWLPQPHGLGSLLPEVSSSRLVRPGRERYHPDHVGVAWSTSPSPTCAAGCRFGTAGQVEYRARWAAHRAAASVATGDGGAWLEGDKARAIACDAMTIPVVIGDIDAGAVGKLIALCVRFHRLRTGTLGPAELPGSTGTQDGAGAADSPARREAAAVHGNPATRDGTATADGAAVPARLIGRTARQAEQAAAAADLLAELGQQILGKIRRSSPAPAGSPPSCGAPCSARA